MSSLALKYRPKFFRELVGQEVIAHTLAMALEKDRLAHAYLFSGLRGSGKTSSARIFARALECENAPIKEPCGMCVVCEASLAGRNVDIIEMDAASNRSIDSIRDVIEQTKYVPTMSRFKIFIIDEVHMLTKEAFNALLKTLEEPPSYVKFILATTDPLKLPATILSRTQHFRFKKIPHKAIVSHLRKILEQEEVCFEEGALEILARSGGGSLRDTLTLTDQAINYCDKNITITLISQMLGVVDPKHLKDFFTHILTNNEQGILSALEVLGEYECEMIIDEMLLFLQATLLSGSKEFSLLVVDRFLGILSQAKTLLHLNPNGSFVLLLMSLKMREAMKLKDINDAIAILEERLESNTQVAQASLANTDISATKAQDETFTNAPIITPSHTSNAMPISSHDGILQETREQGISRVYAHVFQQLITTIADRSSALGEAFERSITFEGFIPSSDALSAPLLLWKSSGSDEDRALLRKHFTLIRKLAIEVFAPNSKTPLVIKNTADAESSAHNATINTAPNASTNNAPTSSTNASSLDARIKALSNMRDIAQDEYINANASLHTQDALHDASDAMNNVDAMDFINSVPMASSTEAISLDSLTSSTKSIQPQDLILYESYEVRPEHITDDIYAEVPWVHEEAHEKHNKTQAHIASSPHISTSKHATNAQKAQAAQAFIKENHAFIEGIKEHFGARNMIVEHDES